MAFYDESSTVVEEISPEHLAVITTDTKVLFEEPLKLDYPEGLYNAVEDFFFAIRTLPVLIRQITYIHGHIYVKFDMLKQRGELMVWQSLAYLQYRTGITCALCGGMAQRHVHKSVLRAVCTHCAVKQLAAKEEATSTGTWLDKY